MKRLEPMPMPGPIVAQIDMFHLFEWDQKHFWLEVDSGEGMSVPKERIIKFLKEVWSEF